MATNTITITFTPCGTAPAAGYVIQYRPVGGGAYRTAPNVFSSPAVIVDNEDELGQEYEGILQSDCGGGKLGPEIPWSTGGGSVSASESESEPPPDVPLPGFVSNSIPDILVTGMTFDGIAPTYDSGTDFPISTMESGNFITGVNNLLCEVIVSTSGAGTPTAVELTDSEGAIHIAPWIGPGNYTFNNIPIYDATDDWFVQIV